MPGLVWFKDWKKFLKKTKKKNGQKNWLWSILYAHSSAKTIGWISTFRIEKLIQEYTDKTTCCKKMLNFKHVATNLFRTKRVQTAELHTCKIESVRHLCATLQEVWFHKGNTKWIDKLFDKSRWHVFYYHVDILSVNRSEPHRNQCFSTLFLLYILFGTQSWI